jgi:hypothetical protein
VLLARLAASIRSNVHGLPQQLAHALSYFRGPCQISVQNRERIQDRSSSFFALTLSTFLAI